MSDDDDDDDPSFAGQTTERGRYKSTTQGPHTRVDTCCLPLLRPDGAHKQIQHNTHAKSFRSLLTLQKKTSLRATL